MRERGGEVFPTRLWWDWIRRTKKRKRGMEGREGGRDGGTEGEGVYNNIHITVIYLLTFTSSVQQSSYYGLAGMLPQRYAQAVMAGESVAGLVVSLNRIITKASTSSERSGALAFFLISFLFILMCVGCQMYIKSSRFVKYYVTRCGKRGNSEDEAMGSKEEDRDGREGEEDEEESSKELERMSIVDSDQAMLLDNPPAQATLWNKLKCKSIENPSKKSLFFAETYK